MWIIFLIITLIHDLQFIVMRIKVAEILLCTLFIALKALGFFDTENRKMLQEWTNIIDS